jgi:hypothetical protein
MVGLGGRIDRVEGERDRAAGAVLEADRHREAGGEFAVDLRLGGAGTDRAPGDQVGDELRGDGVEELGAGGQAHVGEVEQQPAGDAQALVDVEGAVEVRVVDEALPADGGARLLEVDAHDDQEVVAMAVVLFLELAPVFDGRRIGSWIEQGPTTTSRRSSFAGEDFFRLDAGTGHQLGGLLAEREVVGEHGRGDQRIEAGNAEVVGASQGHGGEVRAASSE